jgi:hypothetical protein
MSTVFETVTAGGTGAIAQDAAAVVVLTATDTVRLFAFQNADHDLTTLVVPGFGSWVLFTPLR